jgi:hypothetical protein
MPHLQHATPHHTIGFCGSIQQLNQGLTAFWLHVCNVIMLGLCMVHGAAAVWLPANGLLGQARSCEFGSVFEYAVVVAGSPVAPAMFPFGPFLSSFVSRDSSLHAPF